MLRRKLYLAMALIGPGILLKAGATNAGAAHSPRLQVGWHDELNSGAIHRWRWDPPRGAADLSEPRSGLLRLRPGGSAQSRPTTGNPPPTPSCATAYPDL